jgi:hypothetical protein
MSLEGQPIKETILVFIKVAVSVLFSRYLPEKNRENYFIYRVLDLVSEHHISYSFKRTLYKLLHLTVEFASFG